MRVELGAARRDDDERVPAHGDRAQRLGHVGAHDVDTRTESLARGVLLAVIDDRDLVLELRRHLRDREADVATSGDDEVGLRHDRFDEELVRVVERDRARRALTQRVGGRLEHARVESGVAERAVRASVGLDEDLALWLELAVVLLQQRRERDGPPAR